MVNDTDNKFFAFGSKLIFEQCCLKNVKINDTGAIFFENGTIASYALDSAENDTVWDNVCINFSCSPNSFFRFTAFALNKKTIVLGDHEITIDDKLLSEILINKNRNILLSELKAISYIIPHQAPLQMLKGRYLWFIIEAFPEPNSTLIISQVLIKYPLISYMESIPEIFRREDNGNLSSMLSMCKVIFDELDQQIVDVGKIFDIETADRNNLNRLAAWQGLPVSDIWGDEKIRQLLLCSSWLIRMKGTKAALLKLLEILLGKAPLINECADGLPYCYSVFIDYKNVPSGKHYTELLKLIRSFSPAGVTPRVVLLRPQIKLDDSYLENNTVLEENATAIGDDIVLVDNPFDSDLII